MSRTDLSSLASPLLTEGEHVVADVRVNWNGMETPRTASALRIGGSDEGVGEPDSDALVTFPSAKQMALVLTGGRVLAWSLGISGRPKEYLGAVPLSAISRVDGGPVQLGSLIRISLKSGAIVDLEAMRGEPGEEFQIELRNRTDGS